MKTGKYFQSVLIMLMIAIAAGCAVGKEYAGKLFPEQNVKAADSSISSIRFLNIDTSKTESDGWVSTDIITGRDTFSKTRALDNLVMIFPARVQKADSTANVKTTDSTALAKTNDMQHTTLPSDSVSVTKPEQVNTPTVVKVYNRGEVRNKKTRE
jgi:hypothetical protein